MYSIIEYNIFVHTYSMYRTQFFVCTIYFSFHSYFKCN